MEKLLLDWSNMDTYTKVPIGYRFVDKVEVIPGKEAIGTKAVSSLDWYFKVHFPGNPVMPGVFLMEAMQQTGLFIVTTLPETKEKLMLFQGCKNMRMYKSVRPGDIIRTYVTLRSYRHGVADFEGKVNILEGDKEILACTMAFTQIVESQLLKITPPELSVKVNEEYPGGVFDWQSMDAYIADPIGYRFVDKVIVDQTGNAAGTKMTSSQDWYFGMYGPTDPFMPATLIMEAIMQTGVFTVTTSEPVKDSLMMFQSCKQLDVYDIVRPGEIVQTYVHLRSFRRGLADLTGEAWKDRSCVCKMAFSLVAPEIIMMYSK